MELKSKKLRFGYTTGACAAAAAKAAAVLLIQRGECVLDDVIIPFPDRSRVKFTVHSAGYKKEQHSAFASVIKDAGDDPDITNGAEIAAVVKTTEHQAPEKKIFVDIKGGAGVGTVTKPGLVVPVGEPAINPVPRRMIQEAVAEAVRECKAAISGLEVTISVPAGEELARKTLNHRLGIVGGISILGTTGIVKPLSEAAWTATLTASFDVAKAAGLNEVVLSTGRTSEKAHQRKYGLPVEAYAMMGDYTEHALRDAAKHGFERVHLCAQWAKMIKIAMGIPQTHVRHGALGAEAAKDFLIKIGIDMPRNALFNTAREIFEYLRAEASDAHSAMVLLCNAARVYCERMTGGIPVSVHLISYEGEILAESA